MIYPSDKEAREQIVEIGRRMFERRYVAANDGNISIRVGKTGCGSLRRAFPRAI